MIGLGDRVWRARDGQIRPFLPQINRLFARLGRWLSAPRIDAQPLARFVRVLERAQALLADTIRATLRQVGVPFPSLDDPAFLVWFAKIIWVGINPRRPSPAPIPGAHPQRPSPAAVGQS